METVQVVSVDNCLNFYPNNLLRDIFEFRYDMTQRLHWSQGLALQKTPMSGRYSEADDQDKPGTTYFAKKDAQGEVIGVIRVSQSIDTKGRSLSMIRQTFNNLVAPPEALPEEENVWETSRILMDQEKYSSKEHRKRVVDELICSTFFYAHQNQIRGLFCFMAEGLWESTYKRLGLAVERLGPNDVIEDKRTYNVYAGFMKIDDEVIKNLSATTGLDASLLDFGAPPSGKRMPTLNPGAYEYGGLV